MPANRANPPEAEMLDFTREEHVEGRVAPIESELKLDKVITNLWASGRVTT